jgi:NAD(P)-dependent dehydrogenase (short-subunit alcohol dehydrogenase family)
MQRTAVVAGVGPGLGASLARKFASEGCRVGLLARTGSFVTDLAADLDADAVGVACDIADPDDVAAAFDTVREELGPVDVLVNHASGGGWSGLRGTTPEELDHAHAVAVRGGLLCSQEAVADMLDGDDAGEGESGAGDEGQGETEAEDEGGTVIFTGATSAVRGRDGALAFSASKFAVRGMAESMARELGPEGVHVAHVVVDGGILPPERSRDAADAHDYLDPDAIAESYWHLVEQDRSAWTLELDLRPHVEEF